MSTTEASRGNGFFGELRRRKVPRTVIAYVIICWGILQVAEIVLPAVGLDGELSLRLILYTAVAGFPVCVALAWFFQITRDGITRTASFEERRVLSNIAPINDRRRARAGRYFNRGESGDTFQWIILFESGPLEGLSYGVDGTVVLGRSLDCDITILSTHVSRNHARLDLQEEALVIEDLDSANGTYVNGAPIDNPVSLNHEDEVRFHDIGFRVNRSYSPSSSEHSALNATLVVKPTAPPKGQDERSDSTGRQDPNH